MTTATTATEVEFEALGTNTAVARDGDFLFIRIDLRKEGKYGETAGGNRKIASTNGGPTLDIDGLSDVAVNLNVYRKTAPKKARPE